MTAKIPIICPWEKCLNRQVECYRCRWNIALKTGDYLKLENAEKTIEYFEAGDSLNGKG